MDEPQPSRASPWRPRISLFSALLLMTIVGLAIVTTRLWREVSPLRDEVFRLRQELGYLSIKDENKIYAIEVPSTDPDARRYRVYLPKNKSLKIYDRIHTLPGRPLGMTQRDWLKNLLQSRSGTTSSVDGGEFTVEVRLRHNPEKKNEWTFEHTILGRGTGSVGSEMPWLNDRRAWSISSDVVSGKQQEFDPDTGVALFSLRQAVVKEFKGGYSTSSPDETKDAPGVMLWIAPAVKAQ